MQDNFMNTNDNDTLNDSTQASKKAKKKVDALQGIEVLEFPNRTLPNLIEELLEKNIPVTLSKNGYYVGGFYALNADNGHKGYAFAQDTSEANTLVFYDNKGHKHIVKSFEDLVKFHSVVWSNFFKISDDFRKPDNLWFMYMLQYDVVSITPGATK